MRKVDERSKELVQDPLVKGMWCVPLHSNPSGVCYSDAVVDALASMETAADDFRIFWDNAYGVHHMISSSSRNIAELWKHMSAQTISHDKLNQLRHVQYFQMPENIRLHMKRLADLLRQKFDTVLNKLTEGLGDTSYATWSSPNRAVLSDGGRAFQGHGYFCFMCKNSCN